MPTQKVSQQRPTSSDEIHSWLLDKISDYLDIPIEDLDPQKKLVEYGLDSFDAASTLGDLEDWLQCKLPENLFVQYPTIDSATEYLIQQLNLNSH